MKLTKCMNGHFYDAEKFASCPHCAGNATGEVNDDSVTVGYGSGMDNGVTMSMNQDIPRQPQFKQPEINIVKPPLNGMPRGAGNGEDVTRPLNMDPGKTVPGWDRSDPDDDEKTVPIWFKDDNTATEDIPATGVNYTPKAAFSHPMDFRPVVGWLVCTEGEHKGQSFNLYHGKNFIGRNSDMDVWLKNDPSVSRNRHAIIIYEPRERVFFAQPGESHELFYVNDSVVLSTTQLKDRDKISVGETTLVFVPFCNSDFSW